MYLLDTSIISYLVLKNPTIIEKFKQISPKLIACCSIVAAELIYGTHLKPSKTEVLTKYYLTLFGNIKVFEFGMTEAIKFAKIKSELKKAGAIIEDFDLMIASICLANDLILVTHNLKHFKNIPGLKVEDWVVD
jgi:tRNA(fMet)-specific endonuclease VapC